MEIKLLGMAELGLPKYMGCLPQSFYTLKNLTVAKLERVILMNAAEESVLLPNLKILQLTRVRVTNFEPLTRFISGCPALETAHMENCSSSERNENDILDVSLPSLKNLKIIDRDYSSGNETCPVVIRAPNLEDLYFEVSAKLRFMGSTPLPCLHSAHVEVDENKSLDHSLIGFFTLISNAKKMSLTRETLCHLSRLTDVQLPVFPNLTHLTMGTDCDIWVLHSLLNSATKLHSLVIDLEYCHDLMNWDWRQADSRPECLLSSLEEIVIENLVAGEDEMSIVAYLLETGAVLKKVKVHLNVNYLYMLGRESRGSLLKLSRRSRACKVELFPHEEE
ncbi:unnamed protein product [Linum trigynum]|uniref:FBD domain-containing protein n=1 Tax=Linum trigynum TaxID=586398 RepID=A0AAV2C8H1_9ROSI